MKTLMTRSLQVIKRKAVYVMTSDMVTLIGTCVLYKLFGMHALRSFIEHFCLPFFIAINKVLTYLIKFK